MTWSKKKTTEPIVTYRGWPGHFICAADCLFRLNTLIEYEKIKIVVSTVGMLRSSRSKKIETIGHERYYETMAFHAKKGGQFWDADVTKQISFESPWAWSKLDDEWEANKGHWKTVGEIVNRLKNGDKFKENV